MNWMIDVSNELTFLMILTASRLFALHDIVTYRPLPPPPFLLINLIIFIKKLI